MLLDLKPSALRTSLDILLEVFVVLVYKEIGEQLVQFGVAEVTVAVDVVETVGDTVSCYTQSVDVV